MIPERYTYEKIEGANGVHYRITDTMGDNRVATSYLEEDARLVVNLMNRGLSQPDLYAACKRVDDIQRRGISFPGEWREAKGALQAALAKAEKGGGA